MKDKISLVFTEYRSRIVSFILALYSLPYLYHRPIAVSLDGAWERTINYCVDKGLTFGNDIVFTYGPLGYLSTRIGLYIPGIVFWAFDLFVFVGFYHFIAKTIAGMKGWVWVILAFFAMAFLRSTNYAQVLFLLFVLFFCLNLRSRFNNYFELVHCALSGVLLFYMKLNYGLISLLLLAIMAGLLFAKDRKKLVVFTLTALVAFGVIYSCVHINIVNYIRYGYELIAHYDEALYIAISPVQFPLLFAIMLILFFVGMLLLYVFRVLKTKQIAVNNVVYVFVVCFACFLFYRNGFTRADLHWRDFFAVFPMFFIATVFFSDVEDLRASVIMAAVSVVTCYYSYFYVSSESNLVPIVIEGTSDFQKFFSLKGYFFCESGDYEDDMHPANLPRDKRDLVGLGTVDIFPYDYLLLTYFDNLNYLPRPVLQSYSVYSKVLDSLNADHFFKTSRPEFIIANDFTIDGRYAFWDESMTKATIAMNYEYMTYIEAPGDNIKPFSYLILRSKKGNQLAPKFEKISETTIDMDEAIPVHFSDSEAIYIKADVQYDLMGSLNRIIGNVPELGVTLFFSDGSWQQYRAVCPLLQAPVLINKSVANSIELANFFTRNLKYNRNITGFTFNRHSAGFQSKINVTYLKLSNYQPQ